VANFNIFSPDGQAGFRVGLKILKIKMDWLKPLCILNNTDFDIINISIKKNLLMY